jgi:outer membrane protein
LGISTAEDWLPEGNCRMYRLALVLILAGGGAGIVSAQGAPPEAAQAQAENGTPAAGPAREFSLQQELSLDLIDLGALEAAIRQQPGHEVLRLGLRDCVEMALRANPDIEIAGLEPQKAAADLMAARGEFDPVLQGEFRKSHSSQSIDQQIRVYGGDSFAGITSIESYDTDVQFGLSGKLQTGTRYSVMYDQNLEESTYGGFYEEYRGQVTFTLTQPVLRGFGPAVNRVYVRQAANARAIGEAQLRLNVLNLVHEVILAYWELAGAVETLNVRRESLENAERLFEINRKRREIGTAADIDVLQAKAGVATRQSDLIAARAAAADAGDRLKSLLFLQSGAYFSFAEIVPRERPSPDPGTVFKPEDYEAGVQASVEKALRKRPEIRMADLQIDNAELEAMRARNEMLPQLDISGTYLQGGRDHRRKDMIYGIREKQDYMYSWGVTGSVPIGNRAARGTYRKARLTAREMAVRKSDTLQTLMENVHLAARAVMKNRLLLESEEQARRLQEANVAAEEKRLRLGVTTSFQVLQVQEDLTLAQTREVQARIAWEKALAGLQLAEGTLLENLGIEFTAEDADLDTGFFKSIRPRWEF